MEKRTQQLRRHHFYSQVLASAPSKPLAALPSLCRAWLDLTQAAFIRLWLYNKQTDQWEIAAFAPENDAKLAPKSLLPMESRDRASVVEYASLTAQPVFIPSLDWETDYNGQKFRVVCKGEMASLFSQSLLCIPLIAPKDSNSGLEIRSAITAHYFDNNPRELQPFRSLLLMGRLSAALITTSYQALQSSILTGLNSLAEHYLTRRSRKPDLERYNYCKEVIALLQSELAVTWASIFYKDESRDIIRCVATTGLWRGDGSPIDLDNPSEAAYLPNQSLTGKVYASSRPFFSQIGHQPQRESSFPTYQFRETPMERSEADLSWIIYPIQSPNTDGNSGSKALGVIRCVGNSTRLIALQPRNFDPIQVQTIRFICKQLAPVLETMSVHIERENVVTVVKHDLYSPLRMIMDEVQEINSVIEKGEQIRPYSLQNLSAATAITINLVDMLDADPEDTLSYTPKSTGLEGDIVARVKNMLASYAQAVNGMQIEFMPIRDVIPRLYIDPVLTERVLNNLISNAIKYGERGSTIRVIPRADQDYYCLDVLNKGIGVEKNDERRIFQGRYRGENARRKVGNKGLGLGLKISSAAMERQGGRLVLTSRERTATVFSMEFPRRLEFQY